MGGARAAIRLRPVLMAVLLLVAGEPKIAGVIFYATGDPEYNTAPPGGELADSGWALQGFWGVFLGTPVSSNYFITAKHVRGTTNETFEFQGASYTTVKAFDHPKADLTMWRVTGGVFPQHAPLYRGTNEVGRTLMVYGRGRQRGAEVRVDGELKGWEWGIFDYRMRWGENEVAAITDKNGETVFATNEVEYLRAIFRTNAGPNEAHLAAADSGGAVFIEDGGVWKLAGINSAVDGQFSTNAAGPGFPAALFDQRGLYREDGDEWDYLAGDEILPSGFYATRISTHRRWIERIIKYGNPYGEVILESAGSVSGTFEPVTGAVIDLERRTVEAPSDGGSAYYRLRAFDPLRITSVTNLQSGIRLVFE